VGSWPVAFTLDDASAMIPGRNLSSATRVTVEARISRSGQALPVSGDLSGVSPIVDPRSPQPLSIVVDHIVP
jgi:cytochrome c-type biogenesis protein CcmH